MSALFSGEIAKLFVTVLGSSLLSLTCIGLAVTPVPAAAATVALPRL